LPVDAVLTIGAKASDQMITVLWEGKTIEVFTIDLRERGEIVDVAEN
jgi:hypothetical protein